MDNVRAICVMGDSLAWGAWDREQGGWVNRLRVHLDSLHKGDSTPALIYNLGIETNTTRDLLRRFDEVKERLWEDRKELNIVIFQIGKNDSHFTKTRDHQWTPLEEYKTNISKLIEKASKHTAHVMFVGLAEVNEEHTTPWDEKGNVYSNEAIHDYNKALEEVCEKENVTYIPIMNVLNQDDLEDGVHPTAKGHEKIFRQVLLEVEKLI